MTVCSACDPLYVPRLLLFEPISKIPVARSFPRITKFTRLALATAVAALGISETAIARPRHARNPLPLSVATSDGSGPVVYLLDARSAVSASQYARVSKALGRAETRLLNDAAISPNRTPPYLQRALTDVASARATATRHQPTPTVRAINDALLALEPIAASQSAEITPSEPIGLLPVASSPSLQSSPVIPTQPAQPTPAPAILYRLDPGHWQLHGSTSVWIEPQSVPQPVSTLPVVAAREVWNGDKWVVVPEHFAGTEISP